MDWTGQLRDAVPADLEAEVLTGDADGTRAGSTQEIHIQAVPLLSGTARGRAKIITGGQALLHHPRNDVFFQIIKH